MGLFDGIRYRMFEKKAIEESRITVVEYHRLSSIERAAAKAWAATALAFLLENEETDNAIGFTKALTYMHGDGGREVHDVIKKVHDDLIAFQREANSGHDITSKCIANGMPLWILSVRAIMFPEIIVHAALAWDVIDSVRESEYLPIFEEAREFFAATEINQKLFLPEIRDLERVDADSECNAT